MMPFYSSKSLSLWVSTCSFGVAQLLSLQHDGSVASPSCRHMLSWCSLASLSSADSACSHAVFHADMCSSWCSLASLSSAYSVLSWSRLPRSLATLQLIPWLTLSRWRVFICSNLASCSSADSAMSRSHLCCKHSGYFCSAVWAARLALSLTLHCFWSMHTLPIVQLILIDDGLRVSLALVSFGALVLPGMLSCPLIYAVYTCTCRVSACLQLVQVSMTKWHSEEMTDIPYIYQFAHRTVYVELAQAHPNQDTSYAPMGVCNRQVPLYFHGTVLVIMPHVHSVSYIYISLQKQKG